MPPRTAQNLSREQKQAAQALLRHMLAAGGRRKTGLPAKWRLFWLRLRLNYEKWRLGSDNPSLFLHKQMALWQQQLRQALPAGRAESGAPPAAPPLSIRQWQRLLASAAEKL